MRIRQQLLVMVVAVLGPVALLAGVLTIRVWELQREAQLQRYQERVSALRLALDTELDAAVRTLSAIGTLDAPAALPEPRAIAARLRRQLPNHPEWSHIGLVDRDGTLLVSEGDAAHALHAGAELIADVRRHRAARISDAVVRGNGEVATYIGVPVLHAGDVVATLYVAIDNAAWLRFLQREPVAEGATLTLNDRHATIIARTLNNERWAGRKSVPEYWNRTVGRTEGAFVNTGLEGQRFYSAFSRSRTAGWVLGTGVPQQQVEAPARAQTMLLALGVLLAGAVAVTVALVIGRRITGALDALAAASSAVARTEPVAPGDALPVAEAEAVRQSLHRAAEMLRARQTSHDAAVAREARARRQAEHASRSKDQFLAMLGHELRNPLGAMKSASALLSLAGTSADVQQRARAVIERQIGHLTAIVNEMLEASRLSSGKVLLHKRRLDAAEVVRHVVDAFHDGGRCNHVRLDLQLAAAFVHADETRLEQVVSNLLDNACKYTPPGGSVTLTLQAQGQVAVLTVRDSGSGIAPELMPHLFDVFSQGQRTLDRSQGGLGLGLTIVRRLVELHGGSVEAHSEGVDRGATFVLRLPLAGADDSETPAKPATIGPRRIVVVEDNADNRDLISAQLRLSGHVVTVADDGNTGADSIVSTQPDVALVDIGLPGLDGMQVARRVRASSAGRSVLLVALTGYGAEETRLRALEAGFDGFLVKPFDVDAFNATVATLDAQRAAEAAARPPLAIATDAT